MYFILGFVAGAIIFSIIWTNVHPEALGTVFIFDDDSMYVQLDNEEAFYEMHEQSYAVFRLKHGPRK